jgi:hypothetical protein
MSKLSATKKRLWKLVSEYVRRNSANLDGYCECVTCGKVYPWKKMDAGHFIGGHRSYNFFDLRNIHPQCTFCNRYMHGNLLPYNDFMIATYGKEVVDELRKYKEKIFTVKELEHLIGQFKDKLSEL